ncbi:Dihydrodipicolinate synthase [Mycoemilia scoparia]|uniref:Dihydrodipicolinate synthase n=1 Tax=Mycoemilia scoparia TaxID=417184 RepID=A0A9W7ZXY3_9FUNG|nr:Dihydrodipicolinate synthase [Mycoemilia scoparia]
MSGYIYGTIEHIISSPIKVALLTAVTYFSYKILSSPPSSSGSNNKTEPDSQDADIKLEESDTVILRDFTPKELIKFNGKNDPETENPTPIYIAVSGTVYDVTSGAKFYGPGKYLWYSYGPYGIFSGRDASRGLAKGELDKSLLTDINAPIDKLDDLSVSEIDTLESWMTFFEGKYPVVGKLIDESAVVAGTSSDAAAATSTTTEKKNDGDDDAKEESQSDIKDVEDNGEENVQENKGKAQAKDE